MPNLEDKLVDIETDLKKFSNILQQKNKVLKIGDDTVFPSDYDNPLIRQEKYKKR